MKSAILERFKQSGPTRNILTLLRGTAISQILLIAAAPVLTRIYTPASFGKLALFISIVSILSVVVCWRYELAIVLPKEDKDAANLLILSVIINLWMCFLTLLFVLFFAKSLGVLFGVSEIVWLFWLLPISLFLLGIYQSFNYWSTRKKQFKYLSISRVNQAATGIVFQLGFGFLTNLGAGGLLGGYLISQFVGTSVLIGQVLKNDCISIIRAANPGIMLKQAIKYRKYPLFSSWSSFLDNIALALPILFFAKYFDLTTVGFYSLGMRLFQVPLSTIGASVSQVFFQRIADEYNKTGTINHLVEKTFKRLALLSLPILFIMFFAPPLFELAFGPEWRIAGVYLQIISPALTIRFVTSPLSIVFSALNRQELAAVWKIIAVICTPTFLLVSLWFDDPLYSVVFLSINDTFLYLLYLILIFKVSGVCIKDLVKGLVKCKCVV